MMAKNSIQEVSFGSTTIQRLRRITLDKNLMSTLDVTEGDTLEVVLLVDTGEIRLRKSARDQTSSRAAS